MPWLAALVCCSAFDLALHDAYGVLHGVPTYETYNAEYMNADLVALPDPGRGVRRLVRGQVSRGLPRPSPARERSPPGTWSAARTRSTPSELTGAEPDDGYPVLLRDWIRRDGLKCLKVKLRGDDPAWDYDRLVKVGRIAVEEGVDWLTADFNCTVHDPAYVNAILDRLIDEHPRLYGMILYVEQPFPYDLEAHRIDVHSVSARKPLFMDESAHDWQLVRLGRVAGLDGRGAEDLQDADRGPAQPLLGQGARDDADGPGPDQPDARAGPARPARRPRRDDHGGRVQRHAVLPRSLAPRGRRPPRPLPPPRGPARPLDDPRARASATGSTRSSGRCPSRRIRIRRAGERTDADDPGGFTTYGIRRRLDSSDESS